MSAWMVCCFGGKWFLLEIIFFALYEVGLERGKATGSSEKNPRRPALRTCVTYSVSRRDLNPGALFVVTTSECFNHELLSPIDVQLYYWAPPTMSGQLHQGRSSTIATEVRHSTTPCWKTKNAHIRKNINIYLYTLQLRIRKIYQQIEECTT